MRVTFGNLKGGVGKSTSSVYLALGLAAAGGRVLLVDADATNRTCLKWSSLAPDWPAPVTVVSWEVPDLARRVQAVAADYNHVVIDTGPQRPAILRQALMVTGNLVVTVAPSPSSSSSCRTRSRSPPRSTRSRRRSRKSCSSRSAAAPARPLRREAT